tara:strand:- start:56 stop:223 length:168 start_codon:yes stop_codon:yes gene_type:complete
MKIISVNRVTAKAGRVWSKKSNEEGYKQTLNWQTIIGLFLIIIGVTIVNLYKTKI